MPPARGLVRLASLASCVLLCLAGCQTKGAGQSSGDPPTAYKPSTVHIDDDSDFNQPDPLVSVPFFPVRLTGMLIDPLIEIPKQQMQYASGDTPAHAAKMTQDASSPDQRREGLVKLASYSFTRRPPYTTRYEQMGQTDSDPTVRAMALRACNRTRDKTATPVFIRALSDPSDLVRLEAVKGLANVPDPNAVPGLLRLANNADENPDVRIFAVDALKYYRTMEVARNLSELLSDADFGVAWQAHRSLVYLTHRNLGQDRSAWLGYFAGPQRPF